MAASNMFRPTLNKSADDSIKLISYNMHGFNQGILELEYLCTELKYDIIFIQEHWLSDNNLNKFDSFLAEYFIFHGKSAMHNILSNGILHGRPYGGICVFIRRELCKKAKTI